MRYIDYSNFKPDAEWLKKAKDLTDKMIELPNRENWKKEINSWKIIPLIGENSKKNF